MKEHTELTSTPATSRLRKYRVTGSVFKPAATGITNLIWTEVRTIPFAEKKNKNKNMAVRIVIATI